MLWQQNSLLAWSLARLTLSSRFPSLFYLSILKAEVISHFLTSSSDWDFHFLRNLQTPKLLNCLPSLLSFRILVSLPPVRRLVFRLSLPRAYSPSLFFPCSFYPLIYGLFPHKTVWTYPIPSKVQVFLWEVAWIEPPLWISSHLLTPTLPFCLMPVLFVFLLRNLPTIFFIRCPFSWGLRGRILQLVNISCALPAWAFDLVFSWRSFSPYVSLRKIWVFCLHALIWTIWKERNRQVFEHTSRDLSLVYESFLFLVANCSRCGRFFFLLSFWVISL